MQTDNMKFLYWSAGLGSRSQSEPSVFGYIEPEPLEKKDPELKPEPLGKKSGAGAAKKLAGSSALIEDKKKHKEIILLLLFFM